MKIGIIASTWIKVPPEGFGFGAQEYLTYHIAEGLIKKGHEVTLFASGDSKTTARHIPSIEKAGIRLNSIDTMTNPLLQLFNLSTAYKYMDEFDIIHNHLLPYGLFFEPLTKTPTVHTLHHAIHHDLFDIEMYKRHRKQRFISISDSQRKIVPELNYIATVYNGVDPDFYQFQDNADTDYLLYIGRMKHYKGIDLAIDVAEKLGLELKIAALLPVPSQHDYKVTHQYWKDKIKPRLSNKITHLNNVIGEEKVKLLQNAKALIFPVEREEPFGMTVIEAMSCGTPVIAYARGAMPELVADGRNGFLVNDPNAKQQISTLISDSGVPGLIKAIKRIYDMSQAKYKSMRNAARRSVENQFSVEQMVNAYEKVYLKILNQS